jgi:hypothetical protein
MKTGPFLRILLTPIAAGAYESGQMAMNPPSNPTPRQSRSDSFIAFSIMFFSSALLCFMLGWADGVRHDRHYLHIPETGGWLTASAIFVLLGIACLVWSRRGTRG